MCVRGGEKGVPGAVMGVMGEDTREGVGQEGAG